MKIKQYEIWIADQIDQVRSIDNKRLLKKIGYLTQDKIDSIKENLTIILDI